MEYDFDINAFNESKKSMTSDQLQSVGYSLTVMGLQIQDKATFIRTRHRERHRAFCGQFTWP